MRRIDLFLAVLALGGIGYLAAADSIVLQPVADNTLIENALGSVSNGAGTAMQAGLNGMNLIRRALVRFDVAGAIPAGSKIVSASVTLENAAGTAGTFTCSMHRMMASWGEGVSVGSNGQGMGAPSEPGDATWIHRFWPDVLWATVGGEYLPIASASIEVGANGTYVWGSDQLARDVQSFLDAPANNFGWMIKGDETVSRSVKRFATREETFAEIRPRLMVEFDSCPADLNGDDAVDDSDFVVFVAAYNVLDCEDAAMAVGCAADLNGDGFVDDADFVVFVGAYNELVCD